MDDIQNLHLSLSKLEIGNLLQDLYLSFRTKKFMDIYFKFAKLIINDNYGGEAKIQKIPSIRINCPGTKSVNYHNDRMYGHGTGVFNLWIPLVKTEGTNSLYVLTPSKSEEIVKKFELYKWSINKLNNECKTFSKSLDLKYGEIYHFSSNLLHGSHLNISNRTRVSIDARILIDDGDYGKKDKTFFVSLGYVNKKIKTKLLSSIYMSNSTSISKYISTRYQSSLCQYYALNNNMDVVVEETEINNINHSPNLTHLLDDYERTKISSIIMFSIINLPSDPNEREQFLNKTKKLKIQIHCVCEDIVYYPENSIQPIINLYNKYRSLYQ